MTNHSMPLTQVDLEELREKADAGDAEAQSAIGDKFFYGRDVTQDFTKAREYNELAAAQNHPKACCRLGYIHSNGQGVPRDFAKAAGWFIKSAELGHKEAAVRLDVMFLPTLEEVSGRMKVFSLASNEPAYVNKMKALALILTHYAERAEKAQSSSSPTADPA